MIEILDVPASDSSLYASTFSSQIMPMRLKLLTLSSLAQAAKSGKNKGKNQRVAKPELLFLKAKQHGR